MSSTCAICREKSDQRCGGCKRTYYCSKEHQKQHWKEHKDTCKTLRTSTETNKTNDQNMVQSKNTNETKKLMEGLATGWAKGLSASGRYEWLADCYRMRVDDDYAWGGGNLHGLYDPDATKLSVVTDFLTFCKLAVKNNVIPSPWDWNAFLKVASGLVIYAMEKSDAQDKYGNENVFSVLMGGRSLRATGEIVYGSSCMGCDDTMSNEHVAISECIENSKAFSYVPKFTIDESLFAEVGGAKIWQNFLNNIRLSC